MHFPRTALRGFRMRDGGRRRSADNPLDTIVLMRRGVCRMSWRARLGSWLLTRLDEEQADSAGGMAGSGSGVPHRIYGCLQCVVRSFRRKSALGAIKGGKVTGPVPLVETSACDGGGGRNTLSWCCWMCRATKIFSVSSLSGLG